VAAPTVQDSPWTATIRYSIIAWYAFGVIWSLAAPFWLAVTLGNLLLVSTRFGVGPPTAQEVAQATQSAAVTLWIWAAFTVPIDLIAIVGALRRVYWAYIAVIVFLSPWVFALAVELITIPTWGTGGQPVWSNVLILVFAVVSTVLAVWMVIAIAARTPASAAVPPPS
jgi:hypothetical protein